MSGFSRITIFVLFTFACTNAKPHWKQFVPEGKETIYAYKALVKAATHVPHPFASEFLLNGKLHLQIGSGNELLVRMDNLQYGLDNGRESETRKYTMQPSHLEHVTNPFKIVYEDIGTVKEIITEEHEPEYALNMKKAIAVMLQMNWEKIPLDSVKPFAFSSREKSLFGTDNTLYNVMPTNDTLKIYRMHYMHSTRPLYNNLISDFTQMECDAAYEEPITHDTQKQYVIDRKNPHQYMLKYMESNGGVYFQPSQGKSSAFYVYINQSFHMMEMVDKKVSMVINKEAKHTSLQYILNENSLPKEHVQDPTTLMPIVQNMLSDMVEYVKEDKIKPTEPDMAKGQYINRIITILSHLDVTMLEELYTKLSAKMDEKEMFEQIIPMVGTKASLKFIMKIIEENKIQEQLSINMLQKMSLYIRIPTVQMITEMDGMLQFNNAPWLVQKAAILSYGTLLHKLHEFNVRQGIETADIFEKYIQLFVNKIKTSQKIEEQYLYLDTLYNMRNDLVIRYLEPIIKGEWFNDNRLRYKAMLSVSSVITTHAHHDKMYELYLPIMTDTSLPAHMRIMAFYFAMKSKPSISCQINIYSSMKHEKDVDVLNFYYSYLKSLMDSQNPCLYRLKLQAKQLLIYWPLSYIHTLTQFQKIDMTNWKYNYGQTHDFGIIDTKEAIIFMWKMDINVMNLQTTPTTFYVKVNGMEKGFLDNFYLQTKKGMKYINYDKLFTLANYDNIEIEIVHMRNGQITENSFYNKNNIQDMRNYFKIFYASQFSEKKKTLDIHFDMMIKMLVPSDIGLPVLFELLMPSIHETNINLSKDESNKIINVHMDNKYRIMNYFSYGLSFYNPFASAWQGIAKYMYLDTQLPVYVDLSLNSEQNFLKVSWKRHQNKIEDVIGYRSFAATYVYVRDQLKSRILQKSTPTAKNYVRVTHNNNYKRDITVLDTEEYNLGYKQVLRLFNEENPKYYQKFSTLQDFLFGMESWSEKVRKFILESRYIQLQHDVQERGVMLRMEPSGTNPVTSIELSLRFHYDIIGEAYALYQPAMRINLGASYTIKNNEKAMKTWNINGVWDLNNEHIVNSLKLDISRHIPGQNDYKICVQGMEKYSTLDLTGHMTIKMGQSVDGKCNNNETIIRLTMKAEQLPEQKQRLNNFDVCHHPMTQLIDEMRHYSCYMDRSSLRYYTVDVKAVNFPTEFKNMLLNYWRMFLSQYQNFYVHLLEKPYEVAENNLKIQFRYPVAKDTMDMRFITSEDTHKFKGLPAKDFTKFGMYPDNLYYSNVIHMLHNFGLTNVCVVDRMDIVTINGERLSNVIDNDWTLILADSSDNTKRGARAKLINDKLAIKMNLGSEIVKIVPNGEKYTLTMDGKEWNEIENIYLDHLMISKMEDSNTLVLFSRYVGGLIIYNGHQVLIEYPKTDFHFSGKCLQMKH